MKTKSSIILSTAIFLSTATIFAVRENPFHRPKAPPVAEVAPHTQINEFSASTQLVDAAQARLQRAGTVIADAEHLVKQQEDRLNKVTQETQNLSQGLEVAKSRLARLHPALENGGGINIGGVSYSSAEIKTEARRLENFIKASAKALERKTYELNQVQKITTLAQAELEKSRSGFNMAQGQLGDIDVRIKLAETSHEVSLATSSAHRSVASELEGDFSRVMEILEKRLSDIQEENSSLGSEPPSGGIAWDTGMADTMRPVEFRGFAQSHTCQ